MTLPSYLDHIDWWPPRHTLRHLDPNKRLWLMVATQALTDAYHFVGGNHDGNLNGLIAFDWAISEHNPDRAEVLLHADVCEADFVSNARRALLGGYDSIRGSRCNSTKPSA